MGSASLDEAVADRERVVAEFFERERGALARACLAMARAFARGGTLIPFGTGAAATDAAHAAVEFMHPVIVGKRALPALAPSNDPTSASTLSRLARPEDVALALSHGHRDPTLARFVEAARAKGLLTIEMTAAPQEPSERIFEPPPSPDHVFAVPSDDRAIVQEVQETAYHVLWELVHVFFEQPGFLEDGTAEACITCGDVAVRARVAEIQGPIAVVERDGAFEKVAIDLIEGVTRGDMLLCHAGGALEKLDRAGDQSDQATATLYPGARPLALSAGFIVEEGFPVAELERIAASMGAAAEAAGVPVATGDTKVVERGKADGLYINTSGVGLIEHELALGPGVIESGDKIIVSGPIGDHGMAVMIARGELDLEVELASDTAPLHQLVATLLSETDGLRCLRDPTRGGLATVLAELALAAEVGITIDESEIPIRREVSGACEILGIDPIYVANEGKLIAVVAPDFADGALAALRSHPLGREAAIIAEITPEPPGLVILETAFGGSRVVDMLAGDPLPRIC